MLKQNYMGVFYPYHPFNTFIDGREPEFINKKGESVLKGWFPRDYLPSDNPGVAEVFNLGLKAYQQILKKDNADQCADSVYMEITTANEFDEKITSRYLKHIREGKELIRELHEKKNIEVINESDGQIIPLEDLLEMPNSEVLMLLWSMIGHNGELERLKCGGLFIELFSIAVLEEIGNILVSLCLDNQDLMENMGMAQKCYSMIEQIKSNNTILTQYKTFRAKTAVKARLNNDPRQKEKEFIKDCWIDWQADKSKYKSKAAFSRDMLKKVENLTSQKKIEDWCREWEKECTTRPAQ